jgi:aminoglycoside/choline kinase family phosphotransferase
VRRWRSKALADLYRLEATYSRPTDAPASFFLKRGRPEETSAIANSRRWKEHEFYTRLAPVMTAPPVPRLFSAAHDPHRRRSHLLLQDLTGTHGHTPVPLPPTPDQLRGEVDCLAAIHADWWNHPELAAAIAERDDAWIEARTATLRKRLGRFLIAYGDHLPQSALAAQESIAAVWPAILRRSAALPLTVVHGDAHPWNFLTPLTPDGERVYLLDWEGWSIEPGPHDLASLIALHLPTRERRELEESLVARYARRLRQWGVAGCDDAVCWNDYRRAVARRVLSPSGLWSRGARARAWWPALEHITAAFHDLRCEEVLAG